MDSAGGECLGKISVGFPWQAVGEVQVTIEEQFAERLCSVGMQQSGCYARLLSD